MKHLILQTVLFTLCLLLVTDLFGQNIDPLRANISYTQFPNVQVPENVTDYKAVYLFDDHDLTTTQSKSAISNFFIITNLAYNAESDNRLVVRVEPLELGAVTTSKKEVKKKEGEKEITTTTYTAMYTFSYPFEVKFSDEDGNIIVREQLVVMEQYQSQAFNSASAAEKFVEDQRGELKRSHKDRLVRLIPTAVRSYLNNTLNTLEVPVRLVYSYVKNNKWKKFTYPELQEAARLAQMACNGTHILELNKDQQAVNDLTAAIDIWEGLIRQMDLNNRKSRINKKLAKMLYENIAHAYFSMNDLNSATTAIRKQGAVKASLAGTSGIGKIASDLKLRYDASGINYK